VVKRTPILEAIERGKIEERVVMAKSVATCSRFVAPLVIISTLSMDGIIFVSLSRYWPCAPGHSRGHVSRRVEEMNDDAVQAGTFVQTSILCLAPRFGSTFPFGRVMPGLVIGRVPTLKNIPHQGQECSLSNTQSRPQGRSALSFSSKHDPGSKWWLCCMVYLNETVVVVHKNEITSFLLNWGGGIK
jgi:hypothetical protein